MADLHLPRSHFQSLLIKMNVDRQEGRFCDVQLKIHSQNIPVHRSVLAACSPYFSGMFSGNFLESDKGMTTVDLCDVVEEIAHLDTVVNALYTGQIYLDRGNVAPITQLVSFLMIDSLKDLCVEFLTNDIQLKTSINYFVLADMYDIEGVETSTFAMLESRFHDYFIYQDDMLEVSPHHLCIMFQRSVQRYCDSCQILRLIFSWSSFKDQEKRLSMGLEMFRSMCMGLDEKGMQVMEKWLETHRSENERLASEFISIMQSVVADQEMPEDLAKSPDSQTVGELPESDNVLARPDQFEPSCETENKDIKSGSISSDHLSCSDVQPAVPPLTPTLPSPQELSLCESLSAGGDKDGNYADCVVVLAPTQEVVQNVLEVDVDRKKSLRCTHFDISIYNAGQKIWLHLGTVTFPGVFDEKSNWRITCTFDKLYFLSSNQWQGYSLDLSTKSWQTLQCQTVLQGLDGDVRSVIPLGVNGSVYVLASNRLISDERDHYLTHQRYYRLTESGKWERAAEVCHDHYSTPLSLVSVSGSKIYVVKADIAVNVAKNLLIIKEGHIFDTSNNTIEKFSAVAYVPSPVRVMIREGTIYIIDGEGWMRGYNKDKSQWEFPVQVDLSDIRWCRASSIDGHFPCLSHVSAGGGGHIWELSSFQNNATAMLEMSVGSENGLHTKIHIPPPYKYFALASAGQIHNSILTSLPRSCFAHE